MTQYKLDSLEEILLSLEHCSSRLTQFKLAALRVPETNEKCVELLYSPEMKEFDRVHQGLYEDIEEMRKWMRALPR